MGLADAIPEKNGDKPFGKPKFFHDLMAGLMAGGSVGGLRVRAEMELIGGNAFTGATFGNAFKDATVGIIKSSNLVLSFACKDFYKNLFVEYVDNNERLKFFANFSAGYGAGATATCFSYPLERVFARSAVLAAPTPLVTHHASSVVSNGEGLLGSRSETLERLNRGFLGKLLLVASHRGLYFGLYDTIKGDEKRNFFVNFYFALTTTAITDIILYPSYMTVMKPPGFKKFDVTTTAMKDLVFSKGFMVRSLTGALALAGFDEMQKLLPQFDMFVHNTMEKFVRGI